MGCPEDIEGEEGIRVRDGTAVKGVGVRNAVNERRIKHKTGPSGGWVAEIERVGGGGRDYAKREEELFLSLYPSLSVSLFPSLFPSLILSLRRPPFATSIRFVYVPSYVFSLVARLSPRFPRRALGVAL